MGTEATVRRIGSWPPLEYGFFEARGPPSPSSEGAMGEGQEGWGRDRCRLVVRLGAGGGDGEEEEGAESWEDVVILVEGALPARDQNAPSMLRLSVRPLLPRSLLPRDLSLGGIVRPSSLPSVTGVASGVPKAPHVGVPSRAGSRLGDDSNEALPALKGEASQVILGFVLRLHRWHRCSLVQKPHTTLPPSFSRGPPRRLRTFRWGAPSLWLLPWVRQRHPRTWPRWCRCHLPRGHVLIPGLFHPGLPPLTRSDFLCPNHSQQFVAGLGRGLECGRGGGGR